ncbi:glutamate-rich protein 3 [Labrus mixtus]|uniref:glutamate-rich protein 3 n=1 Tax=Labrus mixtus TaxID=508554 RepID=UPI0029C014C6|nr:glutamate-rich protein 3 [Labrus mixtus]
MSHLSPGLLSAYNSLTDKHLAGYFSNTRIRRHLQRAGLITRSGRIVPDKEYRHKLIQRSHQKHVRECLAQAIFHKVLELERVHQIEIKRKLEEFARRERVHKIKVERSKRYEEEIVHILSPRPPTGARGIRKQHSGPDGEHSESSESPGSSRPNTAPGKMQRPVRLKPIHSNSTTASLRRSSPYRLHEFSNDNNQPFNCTVNKESRRPFNTMEASQGISPYILPVINNFVTPVPPPTKRIDRGFKLNPSSTLRGRRLRPTTASSGADITEDPPMLRSSVHQSRVCVNMMYFGKSVHLSHDLTDMRDEVRVFQQHCGGENLCVFKGKLCEGETFQFISRRHRGFPFSLTFFLNGLQVERLSSCCEFKHRKGSRLGGRHGHFGFCGVEGASPCYKCIIAMGLDKKPTPPPKRVKEDRGREESVFTLKEAPEMRAQRTGSHSESETVRAQDMEVQVKEETAAEEEDKVRDDYEEDFEADDEGPAEDTEAKENKSPSPRVEMERKVKERDTSETEDDHEKDEDLKSRSGSSLSGSDQEESDAEVTKSSREEEKAEQPKEADEEETAVPPDKKDEPQRGETPPTEAESAAPKESDVPNSAGERTEINISDTSLPSGNENKQSDNTSGEKEVEKTVNESKQEEEQERAKSVQEKMAEAILKESHCSSEPELSDTSTEDTIESITKGHERDHKDAAAEKSATTIEQQQTVGEETKCDEDFVALAVVVLDQEQSSEKKEQEPVEKEIEDEQDEEYEEDGKVISEEDKSTAENDESGETHDLGAALLPVPKEKTGEKDKTSEAQEDLADKPTVAAEKKEDNEEKAVVEAYVHPEETGQGAKSSEGDESSLSAPDKKTDETAEPDNVEAMTASETVEMKAESSEEQEALSCEEAPVTGTETSQLGDVEDRAAESKTEVTEGSRDPTDEITADKSQDNAKDESINDINKESVSAVEASKDDNQEQKEEQPKQSVEMDDKKEEKSEEGGKEAEKQTNADETTEGEDCEQRQMHGKDKTEEENNESKTEERIENISNEEQAEKTNSEEDEVANVEKADTSEKTEKDEESECVKNQNDEESVEKIATTLIITSAAEKISETITAGDEAKQSVAEMATREPIENKAEQNEAANNKDSEESVRKKVVTYTTVEVEEKSEKAKEPHKRADGDIDKDYVKKSDGNNESEDVGDSEAANIALATVMAAEMLNQTTEAEDVTKNPERGGDNDDEAEIDAENGEISAGAERKPQVDEGQALIEGANGITTAEQTEEEEEERKTEASKEDSTEVKEGYAESGDAAEKHEEDVAQAPVNAVVEVEANEEDGRVEEQDQPANNESELENSGTGIKEESESDERRDTEETKQDENANLSESDHKNRETRESGNVNEVIVVSPIDHDQSTSPTAVDSDDTALKLESSTAPSDSNTEKQPDPEEHPAVADLSAADGENGDTEEASKASEEGASVLLKPPPAESIQLSQQNEADRAEKSVDVVEETPEGLAREDLVTNWVTMHQTSKYFETFVEPLEDLKEVTEDADVSNSNKEGTQSTELQRSVSPPANSQNLEQEHTPNDINESVGKTKEGAEKLDIESDHPDDGDPCEKSLEKDLPQEKEETEVHDFITKTDSGQIDKESVVGQDLRPEEHTERCESVEEDQVHRVLMQDNTDQTHDSKTEVESIAGANLSVTSGKPESIPEYQIDEKNTDNAAEINDKITAVEEEKDLPSSKTEEHGELSATPERLSTLRKSELEGTEETLEKSREVTEISDFTQSRSDDGSQEESRHEEINPKPPDADTNGESRELQLIQDIKHTLSKDQLSTYSVDETLFPRSSYPLLAVASTESGH